MKSLFSPTVAILLTTLVYGFCFSPRQSVAGEWRVSPIRLDFDHTARSAVISVTNESNEMLGFKIDAVEWSQNSDGVDEYLSHSNLVFFPKILTINPKEEKVVRVGIKVPAINVEKTYRLFITEQRASQNPASTAVALSIQFGIPIFAKPVTEQVQGEIVNIELRNSELAIRIKNQGNTHFRINSIILTGKDEVGTVAFTGEVNGWYLLAGAERPHTTPIPADVCHHLTTIEVQVNADRIKLHGKLDVGPGMCSAQ